MFDRGTQTPKIKGLENISLMIEEQIQQMKKKKIMKMIPSGIKWKKMQLYWQLKMNAWKLTTWNYQQVINNFNDNNIHIPKSNKIIQSDIIHTTEQNKVALEDLNRILQELKNANKMLESNNENLKNSNKQLKADNEKLKADKEQLKTDNEKLKANINELTTENQQLKGQFYNSNTENESNLSSDSNEQINDYDHAFNQCKSISEITFEEPSSLKVINKSIFNECKLLTHFEIQSSVTKIDEHAF